MSETHRMLLPLVHTLRLAFAAGFFIGLAAAICQMFGPAMKGGR